MIRRLLVLIVLLLTAHPALSSAEEAPGPAVPPAMPGVAEVLPRTSRLAEEGARASARIAVLKGTQAFAGQLAQAQERQAAIDARVAELGELSGWSVNRLLEVRARLAEQRTLLETVMGGLSANLAELEAVRDEWQEKERFWSAWRLSADGAEAQVGEAFGRAEGSIAGILQAATEGTPALVQLQAEVTALQAGTLELLTRIDATTGALRKETFKKTAFALWDDAFYRQFDGTMRGAVRQGISQVQRVSKGFWQAQGWVAGLQALVALALAGFIRRHRERAEATAEWLFILQHPWATGLFAAVSGLSVLYASPPALWRLFLWVLAAFSASVLIAGLLKNWRKIGMVYLLAALSVVSLALQVIAFPQPLYRLYLAVLSLAGAPLLLLMAADNVRVHEGKVDGFTMALRSGAAVLAVAFLAQATGYSTLAARLIESSVETIFLGLFAAMAVRLGRGGIAFLLELRFLTRRRFFGRFGGELKLRLQRLFQFFVWGYAVCYLFQVWGLYDSVGTAWRGLLEAGVTVGETTVTVGMALLAGVALYAAVFLSWALRALLETEVFHRSHVDRGVRDSIKRLLHYILVLVGFLFAMGLAGIELQHFVVLAGAFGIGIGFGLQNIVNNFVSGLILLFERPIKAGDVVLLDGDWGTVKKIGLRSTVVETLDWAEVIVPNSQLVSEKVVNWTLSTPVVRVVVPVGVAYGSDVEKVLRILEEAAAVHPEVRDEPPPSPIFTGFGDSSLDFELRVWISDVGKRLKIRSDLGQFIDRRFREEDVEIPFPQRDLHLRSVSEEARLDRTPPG